MNVTRPVREKLLLAVLLPAALLLAAGLSLSCYYETNDDLTISQLLRGIGAAGPVTNLHLYFHGYAAGWAWLYARWPLVPWYGLTLYALLYLATALTFAVLFRLLRPHLSLPAVALALAAFFGFGWLEHGLWFNYVRVPLLLGGAGLLFAAQRLGGRRAAAAVLVGAVAFALAWLIRPSAAGLALLAVAPGVFWLTNDLRRRAAPLLVGAAGLGLLLSLAANWSERSPPTAQTYRRLDTLKSLYLDYDLTHPRPRSAPDSLALRAVQHWQLGDSSLVNEAFFQRALPLETGFFLRHVAPAKFAKLLRLCLRDYFPLLLLQAVLCWLVLATPGLPGRRGFAWAQLYYAGLVIGLGVMLKLPPRLGLPLFDWWLLSSAAYVLPRWLASRLSSPNAPLPPLQNRLLMAPTPRPVHRLWHCLSLAALLAAGPYAYKTLHRAHLLRAEAQRNAQGLVRQRAAAAGHQVLVTDALTPLYKSASPFRNYDIGPHYIVSLSGWLPLDPSQPTLRQRLTGTRAYAEALRRLARRPPGEVSWYLTPAGAELLADQLNQAPRPSLRFRFGAAHPRWPADTAANVWLPDTTARR